LDTPVGGKKEVRGVMKWAPGRRKGDTSESPIINWISSRGRRKEESINSCRKFRANAGYGHGAVERREGSSKKLGGLIGALEKKKEGGE